MTIKEFRQSQGLSQPKLAKALGIGVSTVGGYETGKINPSQKVLDKIREVIERGGKVLIPCFAVGRTQEIMIMLRNLGYDMWVDGMGRAVTRLFLDYPEYIKDVKHLKSAKKRFNEVRNGASRDNARKGDIIVTTGGIDGENFRAAGHTPDGRNVFACDGTFAPMEIAEK